VVTWNIAIKRSVRRAVKKNPLGRVKEKLEKDKASVRAKVEHPFHVLKNLFRHRKTRYRRLARTPRCCTPCSHSPI
jgi:IS5 family transposase